MNSDSRLYAARATLACAAVVASLSCDSSVSDVNVVTTPGGGQPTTPAVARRVVRIAEVTFRDITSG